MDGDFPAPSEQDDSFMSYDNFSEAPSQPPSGGFSSFNGDGSENPASPNHDFSPHGPILPDPNEMREEGFQRREWRRQNAIHLEEKEKKEKEMWNQIIAEAEEYIKALYEKREKTIETNKADNREREKLYWANQDKFHKEVDKHYWKAIAELIPREVPNIIEKKRGKKDPDKKPSLMVIQGPKPGKPTDLGRMRQIFLKLKTNPPPHMMPPKDAKEIKDGKAAAEAKEASAETAKPESADAEGAKAE